MKRSQLESTGARCLAGLALVCAVLVALPARAQSPARVFADAEQAYRNKDYARAAELFEQADKTQPHPVAVVNAGRARERANQRARAADHYAECIRRGGLSNDDRTFAEQRLRELRAVLGQLTVSAPPNTRVSVGHLSHASSPLTLHLEPGTHRVQARSGTDETQREVVIEAGRAHSVTLTFPSPVAPRPDPTASEASSFSWAPWAVSFLVGAGVAGTAALGVGVAAVDARDAYDASNHHDLDARDDAESFRTAANITWIAAGALAATGAVILTVGLLDDTAEVSVGATSVSLEVRF